MEKIKTKEYDYFKEKLLEAQADGATIVCGRIWNIYRYELLCRLAAKDGYILNLIKRELNDVHIFEVVL